MAINTDVQRMIFKEKPYKPLHSGIKKDQFPVCVLSKPDQLCFPHDRIGGLDMVGFLVGVFGAEATGILLSNSSFTMDMKGIFASLVAGVTLPLVARGTLSEVTKRFEGKKLVNKYVSGEAVRRAKEFPLSLILYMATRFFADQLSKIVDWDKTRLALDKTTEPRKNIRIAEFLIKTLLRNAEISLGKVHAVFLEDYDILPFAVSHLLPDTYASRLDAPRLNQAARKFGFDALFALPLQPDVALQFSREIKYPKHFQANKEFIGTNFPFFTASPITLPGIPATECASLMWNGSVRFSQDVGGLDYFNGLSAIPNLYARVSNDGFSYGLTREMTEENFDFLFHPPGAVSEEFDMKRCEKRESFSVLARFRKGEKEGWAVLGNWGTVLIPISKQAELARSALDQFGYETEFLLFRDHSGAVGVSFPSLDFAVGLPPKILGVTEQHTISSMIGAVPKKDSVKVWQKLVTALE